MKLQYLGTAAAEAFPAVFCHCDTCRRAIASGGKNIRNRSGMLVNDTVLIDVAPDIRSTALSLSIDLGAVRDIFITHAHSDHFDVQELFMRNASCFCHLEENIPVNLFGDEEVKRRLFDWETKDDNMSSFLNFTEPSFFEECRTTNGLRFTRLPANHAWNNIAGIYYFTDGEKACLYAHDTGVFFEETLDFLRDKKLDFVSLDCCYGPISNRDGHMGIPQNREMVQALRDMGAVNDDTVFVINHFSHNCGMLHEELEAEVEKDGFLVAYDGMLVTL